MKRYLTILLFASMLLSCDRGLVCGPWIVEAESDRTILRQEGKTFEIIAPQGATLWYSDRLTGDYRITYDATIVSQKDINEHPSDLNCFWGATDPLHPGDFFARSEWRGGITRHYNSLDLFYVGFGSNENTTTRFRRYHGDQFGKADNVVKPLLAEYTDPAHLLLPDRIYRIEISVENGQTTYSVDGKLYFSAPLGPKKGDGYFGLRLFSNHVVIYGLKIERL